MLTELSLKDFAFELSSKKPVPGGGGAAALSAALGTALNSMVANFSMGKKSFLDKIKTHEDLLERGEILREKLITLVDKDAELFYPLSKAYAMPTNTDEEKKLKDETLQKCLIDACSAPVETVILTYDAIILHKEILDISSKNIISDVGVGVQLLKAALNSGYLNVIINLNSINNHEYVIKNKEKIEKLVNDGNKIADDIYNQVLEIMNQ